MRPTVGRTNVGAAPKSDVSSPFQARTTPVNEYGDDWRHDILIESVGDGQADVEYPAFVDGERRSPPEDVGGVTGFMEFLEAVLDPLHEEHEQMVTWYGKPFDPADIDDGWMRLRLSALAARRRGALKRHRGTARQRPPD